MSIACTLHTIQLFYRVQYIKYKHAHGLLSGLQYIHKQKARVSKCALHSKCVCVFVYATMDRAVH